MVRHTIVLVENDPGLLGLLTLELESEGHAVQSYTNAEDFLVTQQNPPDLAILDYRLPGMNGLVLLERLRRDYPSLPALIISSEFTMEYLPAGPGLPMTQLLRKPFAHDAFIAEVSTLLADRSGVASYLPQSR